VHLGDGLAVQVDQVFALCLAKKDEYFVDRIGQKCVVTRLGDGGGTVGGLIERLKVVSNLVLLDLHLRRQELVDLLEENRHVSVISEVDVRAFFLLKTPSVLPTSIVLFFIPVAGCAARMAAIIALEPALIPMFPVYLCLETVATILVDGNRRRVQKSGARMQEGRLTPRRVDTDGTVKTCLLPANELD
jgi:hypothetical protein